MSDSTVAKLLHVSQTPESEDVEILLPDPISIDRSQTVTPKMIWIY